jgi:hypothetical protein
VTGSLVVQLPPLRPLQRTLYRQMTRWNVWVCHRRFGKSLLCLCILLKKALECPLPSPRYAYIAPLFKQAKAIAWDYLTRMARQIPGTTANITELSVTLPTGASLRLLGADDPQVLRGIYLDGVVFDEFAQMKFSVWDQVVRPALSDRQGWAIWIGTPFGQNHFYELYQEAGRLPGWTQALYRASETGVIPAHELTLAQEQMSADAYAQEYECSWYAAVPGAYYAEEFRRLEAEGRITAVPYDPSLPTCTAWDLGHNDANAIWWLQPAGREVRVIDYYENHSLPLPHYLQIVREKPYLYDHAKLSPPLTRTSYERHFGPHDLEQHEYSTGKTRYGVALEQGFKFTILPRGTLEDGIAATRQLLGRCVFDRERCQQGLEALRQYHREWDEAARVFRTTPKHDHASNGADAFRYAAVGLAPPPPPVKPTAPPGSFQWARQQALNARKGKPVRSRRVFHG